MHEFETRPSAHDHTPPHRRDLAIEQKREQIRDVYATLAKKLQAYQVGDEMTADELMEKGHDWKPELKI